MAFITVHTASAPMRVRATVMGDIAVYRKHGDWNIVHVPTGLVVVRGFPSKGAAVTAADEMNAVCDWDGAIRTYQGGNTPNVFPMLREITRRHGGHGTDGDGNFSHHIREQYIAAQDMAAS